MMTAEKKSLMRNLGEFFGHIAHAVKADPGKKTTEVRREVEEEKRDGVTLRRTTIEEIEIENPDHARD